MKRIYSLASIALITLLTFSFTACDEDDDDWGWYDDYDWYTKPYDYTDWDGDNTSNLYSEAQCLRGFWTGTLVNYYEEDGQQKSAQMNVDIVFDQYDSNSLNGRGQETDYVGDKSQVLKFAWYVDPKTGSIFMKYDDSGYIFYFDANRTDYYGFSLNSNAFSGYAQGQGNNEALDFNLTRTTLAKKMTRAGKIINDDQLTFRKR
jgi:hypothetical protein